MKALGVPIGISVAFWSSVGILRAIHERLKKQKTHKSRYKKTDIAVLIPAHNEELVIRKCVQAVKQSLKAQQIYVVSDGSTDKTWRRARLEGVHTSNLIPGKGKAKALIYLIKKFQIEKKYKLIFILDADTLVDKTFISRALPLFYDKNVGVVFASPRIHWPNTWKPSRKLYFIAYRERLNRILQYLLIYGQSWKYTNVNFVIPGFCTIYRLDIFNKLHIDAPGLLIEDFNMAFEMHRERVAKLAHNFSLIAWDQHPDNLRDYWKQIKRWNIGFFQTVKKNGFWPSFFWLSMAVFSFEVITNSIVTLLMPFIILFIIGRDYLSSFPLLNQFVNLYNTYGIYKNFDLLDVFIFIFVFDYITSIVVGILDKKPQMLFYGLFFFLMHYVTSLVLISSLIPGFFGRSDGRWIHPTRREVGT